MNIVLRYIACAAAIVCGVALVLLMASGAEVAGILLALFGLTASLIVSSIPEEEKPVRHVPMRKGLPDGGSGP